MSVGANLRAYLLADPAIAALVGAGVHQNTVPQCRQTPYIWYQRRSTQSELTTDEADSGAAFRHGFDIEVVSDTIAESVALADAVKLRLGDRAAYNVAFGDGTAQAIFIDDHDDTYVPKNDASDEGLHVPAIDVEIIPR